MFLDAFAHHAFPTEEAHIVLRKTLPDIFNETTAGLNQKFTPERAAFTSSRPHPSTCTTMTSIDRAQADKAVNALLKHHEKVSAERAETELLERDEHVWLVINTKRGSTKRKMMPKRM